MNPVMACSQRVFRDSGKVVLPFAFDFRRARAGGPAGGRIDRQARIPARASHPRLSMPSSLNPTGLVTPLAALADAASLGHVLVRFAMSDGAPRFPIIPRSRTISTTTRGE